MPTTPTYGLPYPALTDPPDGPSQFEGLASAVEAELERIDADVATLKPITNWASYTPTVTGGGSASYATRAGRWRRIGPKTVAFNVYIKVGGSDGTGSANVVFSLPTTPSRTIRQAFTGHSEGPGADLQAIVYDTASGGSGSSVDRILYNNASSTGNLNGSAGTAPLKAGQEITFSGIYEEA